MGPSAHPPSYIEYEIPSIITGLVLIITARTKQSRSISNPFNFTHLTQLNPSDASGLHIEDAQNAGTEWNRALERESKSRPTTSHETPKSVPSQPRRASTTTIETIRPNRSRSDSIKSISPSTSCHNLAATAPPDSPLQEAAQLHTLPPPQRTSSRYFKEIPEQPEEELANQPKEADYDDADEFTLVAVPEEDEERKTPEYTMPCIRETQSTPFLSQKCEEHSYKHQVFLSVRSSRPLSQLSQLSDTLSGNFIVPSSSSVKRSSMRARRVSYRLSAHMRLHGDSDPMGAIDDWEQDIDWCYENEAEADCEFDWDKDSSYESSSYGDHDHENHTLPSGSNTHTPPLIPNTHTPPPIPEQLQHAPEPTPVQYIVPSGELLDIPEEPKESEGSIEEEEEEKRITGVFEDRLLLPPSPRFPPSSFGFIPRPRDSGFESVHTDDQSLVMRAGNISLRHRSVSSSPSMPDLLARSYRAEDAPRSYREELGRVARQLDEHIAALNKDAVPQIPKRRPSIAENIRAFIGNRSRADSRTDCVTLCSDTETITVCEASEVVTPSSSAHNSFNFAKQRSFSVGFDGHHMEKGLSFPAAAIPGVVELGPDSMVGLYRREAAESVHYI